MSISSCRAAARYGGWLALFLALLALPAVVAAQTETGRITGTVYDQTGAVLPGVTVTVTQTASGAIRTTVSDEAGRYAITNLQPGPYQLKFELSGFNAQTANLTVTVGSAANVDTKMQVAGTTETVTVVAESSVINTANAEVATTINERQIRELPTITRNVYDLVSTSSNVTPDDGSGRGTGYAINGARSASTNVLLDGSANNDEFSATVGQQVPLDSVQEFSVITNNFSAQYGRATGGIVNVATKSGTNQFRGTGYEFYRADELAANTFQNNSLGIEKGDFSRHQMGFSIGGPIVRDKLHFFTNLEYIRVRSADTLISWVPTQEFINASGPATRSFFQAYGQGVNINGPVLTRQQVSAIVGSSSGAFSQLPADLPIFGRSEKSLPIDAGGGDPQDQYQWISRVDWSAGANTQVYVRYAYQNQEAEPGTNSASAYEGFDTPYLNKNHNLLGSLTHVWAPTFTTQTKLVWNRLYGDQPLNGEPQPTLYMNPSGPIALQGYNINFPGYLPFGPGTAIPFGGPQQLWQVYQDQTWIKGKHDFRFGGSYVHILDDRTFGAYSNAVEALNTSSAVLPALDSFTLGQLRRFQVAINPNGYPGGTYTTPVDFPSFNSKNTYNEFALYANDNWSLSDRFTLNLGLRYEYYGPQTKSEPKYDANFYWMDDDFTVTGASPEETIAQIRGGAVYPTNESPIGSLWASDWNNWAPRVGFAWDVRGDGRTSLRGGYGMAYERNFGNVTYNVLFNPPEYLVASIDAPGDVTTMPIFTDNQGPFGGVAGVTKTIPAGTLRHIDQNIETAYAHFWGLSFQHEIGPALVAKVEYSGSAGRKLYDLADPNKRGAPLVYLGVGGQLERPTTQYAAFNSRSNRGESDYYGFTFSLESRRLGNTGLQFNGSYTYSHAQDTLSSTFSEGGTVSNNGYYHTGYLDAFDPQLDYGDAEYDIRHRGVISGIWVLPFAQDATGFTRALLGDWQLNFIFWARTGFPLSLFDCTNGFAFCMRAQDPVGIDRTVDGSGPGTGNPNEFSLLDLTPLLPFAGGYYHPVQGYSDFGPYPSDMTKRNAFRAPGYWNVDLGITKRIRFGANYAIQLRAEAYNLFNHPNMYVNGINADISSFSEITGFRDDNRRMQLGVKFEF